MSDTRDELISQLVADLPRGKKPLSLTQYLLGWVLFSWLFILIVTLVGGPFRPGVEQQLSHNLRFLFETVIGLVAVAVMCAIAMRSTVPAALGSRLLIAGIAISVLWLGNYLLGLFSPSMEFSMAGKREHCVWETFIYSLPPLLLGLWLASRSYVLNWPATGLVLGAAAGMFPAWLMQLVCMYEAKHILLMHIGPALVVAVLGSALGWLWGRYQRG